jgi:hypothetical protein
MIFIRHSMEAQMTFRERVIATFGRKPLDRVLWQPRIYYWYNGRIADGTMPERYSGMSMLDIYDDVGASPRYSPEVLRLSPFSIEIDDTVRSHSHEKGDDIVTTRETPLGALREVIRKGVSGSGGYHTEYPVKTLADMEIMKYILEHTTFSFDAEAFAKAETDFGDRGVVQTYYPRSPYQRLVINFMGWENSIYALHDHRAETESFMDAIAESDNAMYDVIVNSPVRILNFGENIDANINPPEIYERYFIPYYQKRVEQLHAAGKFCHIHMDGALKPLLPLLNVAGFDGIEAATPLPQGDVTLEELKAAMGDTILLDGIPAILFLPEYSDEQLIEFATRVLDLFAPNLILGISDELPPPAEIRKVRLVSDLVEGYTVRSAK